MDKVVGIIQARMGSTRLPGKVLLPLAGHTALAHLVGRVNRAKSLHQLVVATAVGAENDAIAAECSRLGLECFRGDEWNVLGRLAQAGQAFGADTVVRITADDVLMDPDVVDYMVQRSQSGAYDCATALTTRSFPNGFVVSVLAVEALSRADAMELDPEEREHVIPAFLHRRHLFSVMEVVAPTPWSHYDLGLTLDTAAGYELICDVVRQLGRDGSRPGLEDLLRLVLADPGLLQRAQTMGRYWD